MKEVAFAAYTNMAQNEPGLEATYYYDPPNMTYPNGAYVAVVDVDRETGEREGAALPRDRRLRHRDQPDDRRRPDPRRADRRLRDGVHPGDPVRRRGQQPATPTSPTTWCRRRSRRRTGRRATPSRRARTIRWARKAWARARTSAARRRSSTPSSMRCRRWACGTSTCRSPATRCGAPSATRKRRRHAVNLQYSGEEKIPASRRHRLGVRHRSRRRSVAAFPTWSTSPCRMPTHFDAVVQVGVGPVRGKFKLNVELVPGSGRAPHRHEDLRRRLRQRRRSDGRRRPRRRRATARRC